MKRMAVLIGFLVVGILSALAPPGRETEAQANCFQETGHCITNPAFADYFRLRGGVRILGYPISRSFTLEGFEVQFFQRVVLQMQGGQVNRLNILDPGIMPMTRANQSVFPAPDSAIGGQAPQVGTPDYASQVVEFVRRVAPDAWNGQSVGFFNLFNTTVPVDIAFAGQTPNPDLVTLLNLEIWGLPTSNPAADPGNGGFVYQRFQRGIMHFDASCNCTQGILVGEYLKAVMTGRNLPPDLAADMQGSRYFNQYNPSNVNWLNRPGDLQGSDLTGAFEQGTAAVQPGTGQPQQPTPSIPTATPVPEETATPTPTSGPTTSVELQLDDDLIDSGQTLRVTVIARNTEGLEWIEWQGDGTGDPVLDDNFRYDDCNRRTECASVWEVNPTRGGTHELRARARDTEGNRSEWAVTKLRVRESPTPTFTPSPTVGPGTPTPEPLPTEPNVTIQLSDDDIDLGDEVEITVIATHDKGLDWIQWEGAFTDDDELDRHRYDCDNRNPCSRTWTVEPSERGTVDIEARARDRDGVRSIIVRKELRVR